MEIIRTILTVIYFIVALAVIILATIQSKDDAGLSSTITGSSTNNFYEKIKVEQKKEKKKMDNYFINCICSINNSIRNIIFSIKISKGGKKLAFFVCKEKGELQKQLNIYGKTRINSKFYER